MAQKDNFKFYQEAILKYGISAHGVHWNSKASQYKRFDILTEFICEDINNSTIIDAGCGMGEYFNYLMNEHFTPKNYIGLDCEVDMINISKKRYPQTNFEVKNVLIDTLDYADYYICSGAMNILDIDEFNIFILNCYEKSNKGFLFNFLKKESYNSVTIENVHEFCKKFCKNIKTKNNYLDNDYSIFLHK